MTRHPSQGPGIGGPAKGKGRGSPRHPDFEAANFVALKHGSRSDRLVSPLADRARAELIEACPWLASPAFSAALVGWSRVEAQAALVNKYVTENGPLTETGDPRPAVDLLVRLERLAMSARSALGLDPSSAARIQRDLGVAAHALDLTEHVAEGRRLRLAAEERST